MVGQRGPVQVPLLPKQKEWVKRYANGALKVEEKYRIPLEMCLGMTILESGWIPSSLAQEANNFHGIKAAPGEPFVEKATKEHVMDKDVPWFERKYAGSILAKVPYAALQGVWEYTIRDKFRHFPSVEEGFLGYGNLLTQRRNFRPRYEAFLKHGDMWRFLEDLSKPPVYFTDKGYIAKVRNILQRPEVQEIIRQVRGV